MDNPVDITDGKVTRVWITEEEYIKLRADQDVLDALEACGVDNWSGYSDAMDLLFPEEDE